MKDKGGNFMGGSWDVVERIQNLEAENLFSDTSYATDEFCAIKQITYFLGASAFNYKCIL